ncbi:MAG TPA: amino acid permease [Gammaproteobacteria bacterium]|nr:amino acid permease [Gammaproteobacteria bacterium]
MNTPVAAASRNNTLPRRLGTWTGAAVVVGVIIGSGIFRVPSPIAAETGSLSGVALVWIVGGIVALFGALSVAELAAMYPHAGGPYVYLREAYGRPVAFLFGWMWLLTTPFSWAAQALTFAEYLGSVVRLGAGATHSVAALLIALICAANFRSVRMGAWVQNISTGAKLLALIALAVVLFAFAPHPGAALHGAITGETKWQGVGIALVAVLWAYDGWENLTLLSGEMKDPQRSLPRALIGGTLAVLVIYLTINAAFLMALPFAELAASKSVAADAVTAVRGQGGAVVIAALVMVSTFGSLNGSILSDPRVFYAMAEDGLFFRSVGKVHPRFETPYVAIAFTGALAVIYVLLQNFLQLAAAYVLGIWPFLALAVIGLFVLRRKRPDLSRPYRVLGYPVIPALFVLGTLLVIGYSLYTDPLSTGRSLLVTLAGVPLYYLWTFWNQRRQA